MKSSKIVLSVLTALIACVGNASWTGQMLDGSDTAVRTDGTLKYAYTAASSTISVHGVEFSPWVSSNWDQGSKINNSDLTVSGTFLVNHSAGNEGCSGGYGDLLGNTFWNNSLGDYTITFNNLEAGKQYLAQIFVHVHNGRPTLTVKNSSPSVWVKAFGYDGQKSWTYGGTLVYEFVASGASESVTLTYSDDTPSVFNAVQVRQLSAPGPVIVNPSFNAAAAVDWKTATVSLSNVIMGTDDDGAPAASYSVSCKLNNGASVTKLTNQSGSSASFELTDLADGNYECEVTVTTSAGKSVNKSVNFTIDTAPVPVAPVLGSVAATKQGTTVTVNLSGIVKGTNLDGSEPAASYTVSYSLNGGAAVTALTAQTGTSASFEITNLEPGTYSCVVTITTDKGRTANGNVAFRISGAPSGDSDPLKISEICPKPDARDPNGRESGWIELWNSGNEDVDLGDYEIVRVNRGKELKSKGRPLANRILGAGQYTVVYMSDEYDNAESGETRIYDNDVMVCPCKISPKKFPLVALYRGTTLLEKFVIPVDIPDNQSFAPAGGAFDQYAGATGGTDVKDKLHIVDASAVTRVILTNLTMGAENNRLGEVAYGPNAGPLYGIKHSLSDWHAFPLAKVGEAYPVSLAINPLSDAEGDEIDSVTLIYRLDYARGDLYESGLEKYGSVVMTKGDFVEGEGQLWTASIPYQEKSDPRAEDPLRFKAGHLLRWAAQVTDKAGNTWRTPSFRNPDDGYEWYGTLIEPTADQLSATLPTWHLFISKHGADNIKWQNSTIISWYPREWPNGIRCGIFDTQTSNYYDNVRIDVRGNTTVDILGTAGGNKFSHGLRFSKVHPMQCTDPFSGEKITVRKTSLLAELQDPTNIRSDLSMYLRRQAGQEVPFGYPIRVQMNGSFYQLAHHTNRYTDEYITDYLGYDEYGCAYKNVGTFGGDRNTGGNPTQTLPDDGSDVMPELEAFRTLMCGSNNQTVKNIGRLVNESTNTVVKLYDLPYWFNFLALSRITQECDDDTSTLNLYYDRNGTGMWRPLAYDLHQSFGVYWAGTDVNKDKDGLIAANDSKKGHPLHGGLHAPENLSMGNRAYEGIYQTPKFRRLLLRRLRTLMDEILKEPGTSKEDTPFWRDYVVPMYNAMKADSDLDRAKYPLKKQFPIYVWPQQTMTFEEGLEDMWDNYIVPRRNHFYVTHSITNTAKTIGYGTNLNAGIPLAQSPIATLKAGFSVEAVPGGAVVRNLNNETVDMSGWKLSGAVNYAFPAGSVIDQANGSVPGEVFVVTNRIAYIAALEANNVPLTDQVILGNAAAGVGAEFGLIDAEGGTVFGNAGDGYEFIFTGDYDTVQTVAPTGTVCKIVLTNANLNAGLEIPAGLTAKINAATNTVNSIASIDARDAEVRFTGDGTVKLEGADTLAVVSNLLVKSGTLQIKSTGVSATKTPVIKVLGFVAQSGGTIDMDLAVTTTNQIYGIYVANKDPDKANGKKAGIVYAMFDGGVFNAKIGGTKSSAVYVNKGSVDTTFKGGETVNAKITGPAARLVSSSGSIDLKRCYAIVSEEGGAFVSNRVFKSDKKITITDGHYNVEINGAESEIFTAANRIVIDGGTFELKTSDDCFSAITNITVNGGLFYAVSSANDVFDSNGDMEINGGTILAYTSANGHEAFDVDPEAEDAVAGPEPHQLRINGGTIFATGGKNSAWPVNVTCAAGLNVYRAANLNAGDYSQKYLTVENATGVRYTAKLPALSDKCAILVTCPGCTAADPTRSSGAPAVGSQEFHEFYISESVATNQEQLRFLEIYGSTKDGEGDAGEYIVLTNISDKTVLLEGVVVSSAKFDSKKNKIDDPKCLITLGTGTLPAHGALQLKQQDYAESGWQKITNGKIFVKLQDATGAVIQSGYASFDNTKYPGSDGLGSALKAIRFDTEMQDTTDYWTSIAAQTAEEPPAPVIGGGESGSPIVIGSTTVTVKITNAAVGHRYGYKKSATIEGLKSAEVVYPMPPSGVSGEYLVEIPRISDETSAFYELIVD